MLLGPVLLALVALAAPAISRQDGPCATPCDTENCVAFGNWTDWCTYEYPYDEFYCPDGWTTLAACLQAAEAEYERCVEGVLEEACLAIGNIEDDYCDDHNTACGYYAACVQWCDINHPFPSCYSECETELNSDLTVACEAADDAFEALEIVVGQALSDCDTDFAQAAWLCCLPPEMDPGASRAMFVRRERDAIVKMAIRRKVSRSARDDGSRAGIPFNGNPFTLVP